MHEETIVIDSIAVPSGRSLSGLVVRPSGGEVVPYQLFDDRQGPGGCRLTLDGREVDRWEMLRWLAGCRTPRATLAIDGERYGHVVEARFTSA